MASEGVETSVTHRLAEFAAETDFADLSPTVVDIGTRMLTDTVGVALAATEEPIADRATAGLESPSGAVPTLAGECTGTARDAALRNGILAHALDYDDIHVGMGGHPSAPLVAALLPLAFREGGTGAEFLTSFLVGAEAEIRIAEALNPGLYERGWHPTSVTGAIGAAVAAARFVDATPAEIRRAIGIAASEASGIKANFGTMTKPFHVGNASRAGVEAADLAAGGFTASEDALEEDFGGFCALFRGDSEPEIEPLSAGLGDPWAVVDPRVWFKIHPCCGSVQSAVHAALSLRSECDPTSIESITIAEHPRRLDHTDTPEPTTGLEAKFSVQYCVAAALMDGELTLDHFRDAAVPREDIATMADHVNLLRDPVTFADREYGAAVTVHTAGGKTVQRTVDDPPGSAGNPMSDADFESKYRRCAGRTLPDARVDRSLDCLDRFDALDDITDLLRTLTGS